MGTKDNLGYLLESLSSTAFWLINNQQGHPFSSRL
jgi:hypothetical protein